MNVKEAIRALANVPAGMRRGAEKDLETARGLVAEARFADRGSMRDAQARAEEFEEEAKKSVAVADAIEALVQGIGEKSNFIGALITALGQIHGALALNREDYKGFYRDEISKHNGVAAQTEGRSAELMGMALRLIDDRLEPLGIMDQVAEISRQLVADTLAARQMARDEACRHREVSRVAQALSEATLIARRDAETQSKAKEAAAVK